MERRILDDKDFKRLSKMINGTEDDYRLVLNIVNACDVGKSFKHILCLAPKRWDVKYTMSSKLLMQPEVYSYLIELIKDIGRLPVVCTLDFMMELWGLHCEANKLYSARDVKDICSHFEPNDMLNKVQGGMSSGMIQAQAEQRRKAELDRINASGEELTATQRIKRTLNNFNNNPFDDIWDNKKINK